MIPCKKTFTKKNFTNSLRNDCVELLVSSSTSFDLTTDCWTSLVTQSFIGITIHFIADKFNLKSYTLANEELPVSHNADNLAAALKRVFEVRK